MLRPEIPRVPAPGSCAVGLERILNARSGRSRPRTKFVCEWMACRHAFSNARADHQASRQGESSPCIDEYQNEAAERRATEQEWCKPFVDHSKSRAEKRDERVNHRGPVQAMGWCQGEKHGGECSACR